MHCVDLGESFLTSIYLQNLASIQPRSSFVKFARSPRTVRIILLLLQIAQVANDSDDLCSRRGEKMVRILLPDSEKSDEASPPAA